MFGTLISVVIVAFLYWRVSQFLKKVTGVNVRLGSSEFNLTVKK